MAKISEKSIIMEAAPDKRIRGFEIISGVVAFTALYLLLVSALPFGAARYAAVLPGIAVALLFLLFGHKKFVWAYVLGGVGLYTVLCVATGFGVFSNGACSFWNAVATAVNANVHRGWGFVEASASEGADFLFSSICAVWVALAVAVAAKKFRIGLTFVIAAVLFILICLGLYPAAYAVILFVICEVGLLTVERGLTLKAAGCSLLCAVLVAAVVAPSFIYTGGDSVAGTRSSVASAIDNMLYGSDDLPEGKLKKAETMYSSADKIRLEVNITANTPELYLKGFVGSDLHGNEWSSTDKNAYVQNDYQGLLRYIAESGLPLMQYAEYSAICGNVNKYDVSVKNVSANRKYVYAPYTASTSSEGSVYYDLQRRGGVFTSRSYSFTVCDGDHSGERVTQAQWLIENANRTEAMQAYLEREREYRSFVYDTYTGIDEQTQTAIRAAFDEVNSTSINTVAQIIRAYFLDAFAYSDVPDTIESDFISDFFGGGVHKANAPYFATAATYIFRMHGFAARYAEGYLVRAEQADAGLDGAVEVTGKDAHAWTEVYFDGIGWLPIEVTPTVFSETDADVMVEPVNPDIPDKPNESDASSAPPKEPDEHEPDPPDVPPIVTPVDPVNEKLLVAVKTLLYVAGAALGAMLILLAVIARREIILWKKRKTLLQKGKLFGRAAYIIMERDCKLFGGFSAEALSAYGIREESTLRFIQLAEKSVYGEHELSVNEKLCVTDYLERASNALTKSGGKFRAFVCKYILCIGI